MLALLASMTGVQIAAAFIAVGAVTCASCLFVVMLIDIAAELGKRKGAKLGAEYRKPSNPDALLNMPTHDRCLVEMADGTCWYRRRDECEQ